MLRQMMMAAFLASLLFLSGCTLLNALQKPDVAPGDGGSAPPPGPAAAPPAPPPAPPAPPAPDNGTNATGNGTDTLFIPLPNQTADNMTGNQTTTGTGTPYIPGRPRRLEMTFYNTGFGDATLVRTNDLTFLIDTGPVESADGLVSTLRAAQIDRLDAVIITKWGADKMGGLQSLLDRFVINEIWAPSAIPDMPAYGELKASVEQSEVPIRTLDARSRINYSDLRLEILNPPIKPYSTSNDANSMVIRLYYGRFCVFLPSDIQNEQEPLLLGLLGTDTCEVYKLPYHGRGQAGPSLVMDRLKPLEVVLSTGPNDAGLPSPTTLERLRIAGIRTWRTDVDGDIFLYANMDRTYRIGSNLTYVAGLE